MNEIKTPIHGKTENQIMELIQEFASSWSLVGGRYDDGSMLENANNLKQEIRSDYEALQKEKDKIEDELDQYKEHHEELTEHYKALQFLESEFRKENAELQAENDDQKRKIISLENELVEWNEFKKIRDAQMKALRKQMP